MSVRPIPDRVLALGDAGVERFCEVAGACLSDGVRPELADQIGYVQAKAWLRDGALRGGAE